MPSQRAAASRPAGVSRSPSSLATPADSDAEPDDAHPHRGAERVVVAVVGVVRQVDTATARASATGIASATSTTLRPFDQRARDRPRARASSTTAPTELGPPLRRGLLGTGRHRRRRDPSVVGLVGERRDVAMHHALVVRELVGRPGSVPAQADVGLVADEVDVEVPPGGEVDQRGRHRGEPEVPVGGQQVHDRRRLVARRVERRRARRHPSRIEPGASTAIRPTQAAASPPATAHMTGPEVAPSFEQTRRRRPASTCTSAKIIPPVRSPRRAWSRALGGPPAGLPPAARHYSRSDGGRPRRGALSFPSCHSGEWRNWQTRWLQVPVSVRTWGFKSPLAHHTTTNDAGRMPDLRTSTALRQLPELGCDPPQSRWRWSVVRVEPTRRIVFAGRGTGRAGGRRRRPRPVQPGGAGPRTQRAWHRSGDRWTRPCPASGLAARRGACRRRRAGRDP